MNGHPSPGLEVAMGGGRSKFRRVTDVDPDGVDPRAAHLVEHPQVVGRLELDLDRQAARLLDRRRAAADVDRAAVAPVQRPGRERDVDGVVEVVSEGRWRRFDP